MADATLPFQARALLVEETAFGTKPTDPAYKRFSDTRRRVQVGGDPQRTSLRDIESENIISWLGGIKQYTIVVDFDIQRDDQLEDFVIRQSTGKLKSWTLEVAANIKGSTKTYFEFSGCKPNSVNFNTDVGGSIIASVEFFGTKAPVISTTEPSIGTGSREPTIGTDVYSYVSGDLERPSGTAFAFLTRNWSVTLNNNLTRLPDVGNDVFKELMEGQFTVEGSADIAVEDGGKVQFEEAMSGIENDLVLFFGITSGDPKWTFGDVQFPNATFEFTSEAGEVFFDRSWGAKDLTVGTVT